jgi:hypothetical protein
VKHTKFTHLPALLLGNAAVRLQQDFPTDVDFKWAQDSYNVTQRNTDTWVFFAVFRARLWLLDQKWSYPGGFTGVLHLLLPLCLGYVRFNAGIIPCELFIRKNQEPLMLGCHLSCSLVAVGKFAI